MSNDLCPFQLPVVQKRTIGDHISVFSVHYQDHLVQAFDDSLVFPQGCLRLLALRDVPTYAEISNVSSCSVDYRFAGDFHPANLAARANDAVVEANRPSGPPENRLFFN